MKIRLTENSFNTRNANLIVRYLIQNILTEEQITSLKKDLENNEKPLTNEPEIELRIAKKTKILKIYNLPIPNHSWEVIRNNIGILIKQLTGRLPKKTYIDRERKTAKIVCYTYEDTNRIYGFYTSYPYLNGVKINIKRI